MLAGPAIVVASGLPRKWLVKNPPVSGDPGSISQLEDPGVDNTGYPLKKVAESVRKHSN